MIFVKAAGAKTGVPLQKGVVLVNAGEQRGVAAFQGRSEGNPGWSQWGWGGNRVQDKLGEGEPRESPDNLDWFVCPKQLV